MNSPFRPPANASVDDDTEAIVKSLDRRSRWSAQKKKNEAANKDGAASQSADRHPRRQTVLAERARSRAE